MNEMLNINEVANNLGIASLKLWSLVRFKKIKSKTGRYGTCLDTKEVSNYFQKHPEQLKEWREIHSAVREQFRF